jgi:putative cardiolipin synthase
MNWKMWQKCVGKMGKKLPIFLFIFILLYVIGSLICYPLLTKRHVLKQKEKYAEQAAKESVDRSASVRCLDDNTQALVYRLALIESAQRELIMTTFDMSDGESGQDLMAAMLQAADRGVRIRLMVDGINAWLKLEKSDLFGAFSTHPNIEIRFYNPIRLTKLWKLNYRMHDKYLIADDTAYILGGRNSNNLFLGAYRDTYNIDRDLYVLERTEKNASIFESKMQ